MTYEALKETMLNGIMDEQYRRSISGLIDCYEAQGKAVEDALDSLSTVLQPTQEER